MICPKCHSFRIRRIRREGFLRKRLAPIFGYYPWRCSTCGTVQLLKARGKRARRREAGNTSTEAPATQQVDYAESVSVDGKQHSLQS